MQVEQPGGRTPRAAQHTSRDTGQCRCADTFARGRLHTAAAARTSVPPKRRCLFPLALTDPRERAAVEGGAETPTMGPFAPRSLFAWWGASAAAMGARLTITGAAFKLPALRVTRKTAKHNKLLHLLLLKKTQNEV